jgi:hypothetical protein
MNVPMTGLSRGSNPTVASPLQEDKYHNQIAQVETLSLAAAGPPGWIAIGFLAVAGLAYWSLPEDQRRRIEARIAEAIQGAGNNIHDVYQRAAGIFRAEGLDPPAEEELPVQEGSAEGGQDSSTGTNPQTGKRIKMNDGRTGTLNPDGTIRLDNGTIVLPRQTGYDTLQNFRGGNYYVPRSTGGRVR